MIDAWMDNRLREALKKLPPLYRMIVVMREMEGLSTREVATVTGISEANEAIAYSTAAATDPIARLQARMDRGEVALEFDEARGCSALCCN